MRFMAYRKKIFRAAYMVRTKLVAVFLTVGARKMMSTARNGKKY